MNTFDPHDADRPAEILAGLRGKGFKVTLDLFGVGITPAPLPETRALVDLYEPQIKALLEGEKARR